MTRLRTQREVSEYFGKNPNDRSFISRNIKKGKIIKENGWYTIVEEVTITPRGVKDILEEEHTNIFDDYENKIRDLKIENDKLKKELKEEKEKSEQKSDSEWGLLDIDNLKYLMDMLQRRNKFIQAVIKDFFDSHPWQYDRDWAIAEVYKKYKFEENPTDDDEIMYVLEIISDNEKN